MYYVTMILKVMVAADVLAITIRAESQRFEGDAESPLSRASCGPPRFWYDVMRFSDLHAKFPLAGSEGTRFLNPRNKLQVQRGVNGDIKYQIPQFPLRDRFLVRNGS